MKPRHSGGMVLIRVKRFCSTPLQTYAEALGIRLPIDRTDRRETSLLAKKLTFADPFPPTHPFRRYDREKGELVSEYVEAAYQKGLRSDI